MQKSGSGVSISDLFRPNHAKTLTGRDLSKTRLSLLKSEIKTDLHLISLKDLYAQLKTDPDTGLTSARAAEVRSFEGPNKLTPATHQGWVKQLLKALFSGFSILIWLGAALCIFAYIIDSSIHPDSTPNNMYLGCVLIAVDTICGFFSFFQSYKSSKIMKTFNDMIPTYTRCIRDGVLDNAVPVSDLVKGDIVMVQSGDIIPADIRIIDSKGFKVDNSSLTGECIAVTRHNSDGVNNILESTNMAFFSTLCVEGSAKGIVICCGDLTALGRVAGLADRLHPEPSPLAQNIKAFMKVVSIWALGLGVVIGVASLCLGYPVLQSIIFVIGIIVANVPEGLQPTVTAALTLTAQQMVKKKSLVKNLESIEALGACSTICSDKTGTLTKNEMGVIDFWIWDRRYSVQTSNSTWKIENTEGFESLKICGSLCSTAILAANGSIRGDASETAILKFLQTIADPISIRQNHPKIAEIPFNSTNKYQVSIHLNNLTSTYELQIKGAPENILERCDSVKTAKGEDRFTIDMKALVEEAMEELARSGERVLAFAKLSLDRRIYPIGYEFETDEINFPLQGLCFIGLIGLMDPPREEVRGAIDRVRAAGVRVMMVTGDHPLTAHAIAVKVGIATSADCQVVTGAQLREMPPDVLDKKLAQHYEIVFARTSPTQKLQIVEACQRAGEVVAVTGDGVNDAPALRRADIGISMGITGSQVSKQVADIILMDDNFATIVVGIEEGRKIFDNLKKSLCYILISNVPEIFPVLMFILFSIPLPLGALTILCIDLGTDMWPAVALSYERAESDIMANPPRKNKGLVSSEMIFLAYGHLGLIEVAAGMFSYFVIMAQFGFYPTRLFGLRENWDNKAINDLEDSLGQEWTYRERKELERICQAAYFMSIVLMQIVNGIVCKTRYNSVAHVGLRNNALNFGFIFEFCVACFICYTPVVNDFFSTYPLRVEWLFLALPFGLLLFIFDEFRKYCIRNELFNGFYNKTTYY